MIFKILSLEAPVDRPLLLVLTHDVDWPRHGPPREHVLRRLDRFEPEDQRRFLERGENIYYGVELLMEWEERAGVRSTFFFRPVYDDGSTVEGYSDVMAELSRRGWEIGLHANSGEDPGRVAEEKRMLEAVAGREVVSMRVHMLRLNPAVLPRLREVGVRLDSSLCYSREGPDPRSSGCLLFGEVVELPITVMDTYLFTYWGVKPGRVMDVVMGFLRLVRESGGCIATLLWHDNSARMKGGREYSRLLEELQASEWLEPIRMLDAPRHLQRHGCQCYPASAGQ